MGLLPKTIRFTPIIATVILLALFLFVSRMALEDELSQNDHWCQMIDAKTWYADRDEIANRCAGILK